MYEPDTRIVRYDNPLAQERLDLIDQERAWGRTQERYSQTPAEQAWGPVDY